jgi:hypothetical protein
MTAAIELIVRPFQTKSVTPPTVVIGAAGAEDPVVVTIGGNGVQTFSWSFSESVQGGDAKSGKFKEIKRTEQKIKITNPDDDSQFVEMQRIKDVTLANEKTPEDKRKYTFKYPSSTS